MKITICSNYMNHHQEKLSLRLNELTGGEYNFIACMPVEQERLDMGYEDMNKKYNFIVRPYENKEQAVLAEKLAIDSDIMVFGSGDEKYFNLRINKGGLTLRYAERLFKRGIYRRFVPTIRKKIYDSYIKYRNDNLYVLCSSAYTSYDLNLCGFPVEKCFKWGYFPEIAQQDIKEIINKKVQNEIIWVGRFIDWKHPEVPVLVAERLRNSGMDFHITMVGDGIETHKIRRMIEERKLSDFITLSGSVYHEKVQEYFQRASIFLFTSDFQEGWGAVLNEAMNCGCACVASHAIGSVPYLIKDGENGIVYKNADSDDLYNKVKYLLENPEKAAKLGINGYRTMKEMWNCEVAAQRLINLSKELIGGNCSGIYQDGPCSNADKLDNNWIM